jgi:hypothetical protein
MVCEKREKMYILYYLISVMCVFFVSLFEFVL